MSSYRWKQRGQDIQLLEFLYLLVYLLSYLPGPIEFFSYYNTDWSHSSSVHYNYSKAI